MMARRLILDKDVRLRCLDFIDLFIFAILRTRGKVLFSNQLETNNEYGASLLRRRSNVS